MFKEQDFTDTLVKNINYLKVDLLKYLTTNFYNLGVVDYGPTDNDITFKNYLAAEGANISTSIGGGLGGSNMNYNFDPNVNYTPGNGKFNLRSCIEWLVNNSNAKSTGWCAKHVRTGLEHGGLNTNGRPRLAHEYVSFLPKLGFRMVGKSGTRQEQLQWSNTQAKIGDIAVSLGPGGSGAGHIAMYIGPNQWIADFVARSPRPYSDNQMCWFFRYC